MEGTIKFPPQAITSEPVPVSPATPVTPAVSVQLLPQQQAAPLLVPPTPTPNDVYELQRDMQQVKSLLSNLYVPKHLDLMMKKIGNIEQSTIKAQESMSTCYMITFVMVFLFTILLLGVAYIMWRMNYFKFLARQNIFRRYSRPRSCYSCYRPWKAKGARVTETVSKGSFSSPELMQDCAAPSPTIVRESELRSSSSSSSESATEVA